MAKRNHRQQKKLNQLRSDSYQNLFMNVGTCGDSSSYSRISAARLLDHTTLDNIYLGDGLGRRIVDSVADEMLRAGFTLEGIDDTAVMSRWDGLNLTQQFTDAIAWSRLYGGSLMLYGINDGKSLEDELGVGELEFIRVYDRYQVSVFQRNTNPYDPNYGEVEIWQINPANGTPYYVHASRCYIFDGERLPAQLRQSNDGWGASSLQGIYSALIDFGMSQKHASSLLQRKQQGVWKAKGLAEMCEDGEGRENVRARLNMVDMTRSIGNTIAVDGINEDYLLLNGDLMGVVDLLDRKANLLCALTGIHESILMGKNPAGLNANASTALEGWYQLIKRKQHDELRPGIEKAITFMTKEKTWTISFNPLAIPSDKEQADTENQQSQADERYVDLGVITQTELRKSLRKRGGYVMDEGDEIDDGQKQTPEDKSKESVVTS